MELQSDGHAVEEPARKALRGQRHGVRHPMHGPARLDGAAEVFHEGLVAEADAEHRHLALRFADERGHAAGVGRVPRARREHDQRRIERQY